MNERSSVQSLFKGVRSSKFRHVFGAVAKKDKCYDNLKITKNAHDSNFCAVNPKFIAICTESSGGGSFIVFPESKTGRIEVNAGRVTGHRGPILDLKWNPFNDNVIASCSDDCTVKLWYIPDEGLQQRNLNEPIMDLREHRRRVSYIEWHPTADNILVSSGFDYLMIVWNVSKGIAVRVIDCHTEVIHSFSFNRDGSLLATTCKDKYLRVIEPRTGEVISSGICHQGSKASRVVFLGDSGRLFTTGFSRYSDRQWAVWSQHDLSQPLTIENIDSSSGVLFAFYDNDTRMVYVAGKGDGNIRYYEVTDEPPFCHYLNQFLTGFPQRGLGVMPKRGLDVYKCEVFRFYKLHATRPVCEPISMIVPRKSEQFQADVFPDTPAPTPALSAEEWLSGKNRSPVLISLKTGVGAKTNKPVLFKSDKNILQTSDFNNERKFVFISQENKVDYREKNGLIGDTKPLHNFKENSIKTPPPRKKFPWIKDIQIEEKPAINVCDIVSIKHLPTATFVTLQEDNTDNETTPSLNNIKNNINNCINNNNNNNINNSIDEDMESSPSPPKNERELWTAFHDQCATIHSLRQQLETKDKRIAELEDILSRMTSNQKHIF